MPEVPALHIVSGKGGTGKSTFSAAIAIALAKSGQKVLVVETEGRCGLEQLLNVTNLSYDEQVVTGDWTGSLRAQSIEPAPALHDYVKTFYRIPAAASLLQRSGATAFVTALAPGLRDVLITGKFCEAVWRKDRNGYAFDAIVVDAPPTGRIDKFLNVTAAIAELAPTGRVREHAERIRDVIKAPSTHVHLTTLGEELPVTETIQAIEQLRALQIPCTSVFLNRQESGSASLPDVRSVQHLLRSHSPESIDAEELAQMLCDNEELSRNAADNARTLRSRLTDTGLVIQEFPELLTATVSDLPNRLARLIDTTLLTGKTS
jgi:anion-transporting  ArsA/GET3 family ATPase